LFWASRSELYVANARGELLFGSFNNGRIRSAYETEHKGLNCILLAKDASIICTASKDGSLRFWQYPDDPQLYSLQECEFPELKCISSSFRTVATSLDGSQLAYITKNNVLGVYDFHTEKLWEWITGRKKMVLPPESQGKAFVPEALAISDDGRMVSIKLYGTTHIFNIQTGQKLIELPECGRLFFIGDGQLLLEDFSAKKGKLSIYSI
jgi:WD40 repeat protein